MTAPRLEARYASARALAADLEAVLEGRLPRRPTRRQGLGLALDAQGAIPVDGAWHTALPGVYAIGDVTHLADMFPILVGQLRDQGRGEWLDDEMTRLADVSNYVADPDAQWLRLKLPSRKADVLGRLKALAAWRERAAQARDLPRSRIVKDETLCDIAAHPPASQQALAKVRGLSDRWGSNDIGASLMAALAAAQPLPDEDIPSRDGREMDSRASAAADLLRILLKLRAAEARIAARLIARSEEIDALARGETDLPVLRGWRYEQFGRDARDIVEGRIGFAFENGRIRTIPLGQ